MLAHRADFLRWRREGRGDILRVIAAAAALVDGGLGDTAYLGACPFLVREGDRHACVVYEARPRACRDFQPGGSRCLGAS
jgi:Fe-S-cluster containining protein